MPPTPFFKTPATVIIISQLLYTTRSLLVHPCRGGFRFLPKLPLHRPALLRCQPNVFSPEYVM